MMLTRLSTKTWLLAGTVLLFSTILYLAHSSVGFSFSPAIQSDTGASFTSPHHSQIPPQSVLENAALPNPSHGTGPCTPRAGSHFSKPSDTFAGLLEALDVMQSHYYVMWQGQWPTAIDWTAAVMGTHVSAALAAMSEAWQFPPHRTSYLDLAQESQEHENLINRYFTQITSFYFGENAFSLRTQAYDDMLWVVLGWLESVKFINLHSALPHPPHDKTPKDPARNLSAWYARQFIPQFAHRARLFYDLASKGWDTSLCGGGMVWNPYLAPYKNAITNQLFISASISMYLYFPGDHNSSPFSIRNPVRPLTNVPPARAHDPKYLENAVEAYQWLNTSGMTNWRGLYVDGFHITGWRGGQNGSMGTGKCDLRDEQVYTYNQGVILSGLRGLWEATGFVAYLDDGHRLIRNVIAATGWNTRGTRWRWQWSGLGRNGVMEEACDSTGTCSQNGHTFKGIFFHHLTLFCHSLPSIALSDGDFKTFSASDDLSKWHKKQCKEYGPWLRNNAQAACITRNDEGEFGTWWGIPGCNGQANSPMSDEEGFELPLNEGTDYRNDVVPRDMIWRLPDDQIWQLQDVPNDDESTSKLDSENSKQDLADARRWDPNNRGRGRTVETQSGGLAIIRALWKIIDLNLS
ncbi:MAG: hypothetical protein L6R37_005367 [Teloschistes peruensis]|nr:MAG: hypothetical protein L6R37_005367 [Teloschistes peruensis]